MVSLSNFLGRVRTRSLERAIQSATRQGYELPVHVGLIPDGNRRFAKKHHLSPVEGHMAGYTIIKKLLDWALESGIRVLTIYAFSTENFTRPAEEVEYLMRLLVKGCREIFEDEKTHKNRVRIHIIGNRDLIPAELLQVIDYIEEGTSQYDLFDLNIAIAYGGRDEILRAIRHIVQEVQVGNLVSEAIAEPILQEYLDTGKLVDPDLIIRTGGEQRVSGFLSWQGTYSELCFQKVLFPGYQKYHFLRALHAFQMRNRRFGK